MTYDELCLLAKIFQEAATAANPMMRVFQELPPGTLGTQPFGLSISGEDLERGRIFSSVLGAIAGAYQRAADQIKERGPLDPPEARDG